MEKDRKKIGGEERTKVRQADFFFFWWTKIVWTEERN